MSSAVKELLEVAVAHERALERAQKAGEERAVAVYRARVAGVTLAEIARVLRVPRSTVPPLARRGAALAGAPKTSDSPEPPCAVGPDSPEPTSEARALCVRDGCPAPAASGSRLCSLHFYG